MTVRFIGWNLKFRSDKIKRKKKVSAKISEEIVAVEFFFSANILKKCFGMEELYEKK